MNSSPDTQDRPVADHLEREWLTGPHEVGDHYKRTDREHGFAVDHRSFRDQLAFSIGFAVTRSRALLRRLLKEHTPDDARQMLAERVVEELELSFEIDEFDQVMRKRPPTANHG